MNDLAHKGWIWAHEMIRPMWDRNLSHADAAACAILIAYRAGIREGMDRCGKAPSEIPYSDFDITDQMKRFDEGIMSEYDWPTAAERAYT